MSWSDHRGRFLIVTALLFDPQHGPGLWAAAVFLFWEIILFAGTQQRNGRGRQILEESWINVLFSKDKAGCEKPEGTVWSSRGSNGGGGCGPELAGLKKEVVTGARRDMCGFRLRSQPGLCSQGSLTQSLPTALLLPSGVPTGWTQPGARNPTDPRVQVRLPGHEEGREEDQWMERGRWSGQREGSQPSISESLSGMSVCFSWFMQHKTPSGQ